MLILLVNVLQNQNFIIMIDLKKCYVELLNLKFKKKVPTPIIRLQF